VVLVTGGGGGACVVVVGGGGLVWVVVLTALTALWWATGLAWARCLALCGGLGLAVVAVAAVVADCVVVDCVVAAAGVCVEVEDEEPHALTTAVSTRALIAVRRCVMVLKDARRRQLLPPDLNNR
jgi:hypothetical protein